MAQRDVLILSRTLPWHPGAGGLEAHAWGLARAMGRSGDHVMIYTTRFPGDPQVDVREGVRIRYLTHLPRNYQTKPWWRWWGRYAAACLRALTHDCDEEGYEPDLIISEQLHGRRVFRARHNPVKPRWVYFIHGTSHLDYEHATKGAGWKQWLYVRYQWARERRWLRYADAVVAVAPHVKDDIVEHYRLPPGLVHVVPNGSDPLPDGTPPAGMEGRQGFDLYLGRIVAPKGVRELPVGCVIAGDGPLLDELRGRHEFTVLGPVTEDEKGWLMRHARRLVLPSRLEGDPVVAAEAAMVGLPVEGVQPWGRQAARTWDEVARSLQGIFTAEPKEAF